METRVCFLRFFFLLALSSFFNTRPSLCATRCNPSDYNALMNIKKSLNSPYILISWVPNTDCCGWNNLECDERSNRVTTLNIANYQVPGQIPVAVGDLPYLNTLIIRKLVNLTGPIPQSITKLQNLRTLWLSWNSLTGPVPDFLSQLRNLVDLDLSFNQFSGSIPAGLSTLTNLRSLHLDRNKLTGPIPESFGRFAGSVPDLYLSNNQLSGQIPKSLGNLDFSRVYLSRNNLVGDASMLFGSGKTTEMMDLSRNLLEFDFSKVRFSKKLIVLYVDHNRIYGSLPMEMTTLDLQFLNVSYNRLCGEIPVGGRLQSHDYSSYFHNKCLCGLPLDKCS